MQEQKLSIPEVDNQILEKVKRRALLLHEMLQYETIIILAYNRLKYLIEKDLHYIIPFESLKEILDKIMRTSNKGMKSSLS